MPTTRSATPHNRYEYDHVGDSTKDLDSKSLVEALSKAKKSMIVCGSTVFDRVDGDALFAKVQQLAASTSSTVNVLHTAAGQVS